jgi:MFS family permease
MFQVNPRELGFVLGSLAIADEVVSIIALAFWGTVSDRLGRQKVLVLGYAITSLSLFVIPIGNNWAPDLILTRNLFAIGSSALSSILAAMLADVVQPKGIPRAVALAGLMAGAGALIAAYGYLRLGTTLCMEAVYFSVGSVTFVLGCLVCFLYRNAPYNPEKSAAVVARGLLISIPKSSFQNPFLGLSFLASFGARSASIVGSLYISSWFTVYMTNVTFECPQPSDPSVLANATVSFCDLDTRCNAAVAASSSANGILQACALVCAPLVAVVIERLPHPSYGVLIASVISAFGFSIVAAIEDPNSSSIYGVVAVMGLGQIALVISSQVLLISNIPSPQLRGTASGVFSAVGGMGVITVSAGGGNLFDSGFYQGPFVLTGAICAVLALVTLAFIVRFKPKSIVEESNEEENTKQVAVGDM